MTYYYGVVYFKNGEASISNAYDSLDECMNAIKEGVMKHPDKIQATSYMTRQEKFTTMQLFGCPKTRDVMRDKNFVKYLNER